MKKTNFDLKEFSEKQQKILFFWQHPKISKYDMIIADGAIRAGKTIAMIVSFIMWSMHTFSNKGGLFIIAGKSVGALKRNVIQPMIQILNFFGIPYTYNRSGNYIQIRNNYYYLFGANNEASQDVLQGLTASGALADEIALYPESFVKQMIGRCSVEGSKVYANCNPQNPYHFFKTDYIDKAVEKMIYYLHFTMEDNLTLSEQIKNKYKRMFSGVFYKRYILGLWVMAEGIIYNMFDEKKHILDTSKLVFEGTNNLMFEEYNISIDYGVYNAFSAGLWGRIGNKHYRLKEFYYSGKDSETQKDNEEYYKEIVKLAGNRLINNIIIDPSASSFIQTIKKYGKFYVRNANNAVNEGIENVQTALNKNILFFDKECSNTLKEFATYSWDIKSIKLGVDKPIKEFDHAMDEIRYYVNTIIFNKKVLGWAS